MAKIIEAAPSPALEIKTLMRIGYNFNSALADIIDNSIAAKAKSITIEALPGKASPTISIVDNGKGMTPDELFKSMRLSCKDAEEARLDGDLGRFGSGMKTASFSQARKLIVISKSTDGELSGAVWDIDLIQKNDSWDLQVLDYEEINSFIPQELIRNESGTAVLWENLQYFQESDHTVNADQLIAEAIVEVRSHIGLYFHRFLSGQNKIFININGQVVQPIDPFLSRAPGYQEGRLAKLRCKGGYIYIKTHVLPSFSKMSEETLRSLGGAPSVLSGQGLYLYREKRLIVAGEWMGLRVRNNLDSLARVQVDIPSSLDNDWSTDVKKEKLILPPKVRLELRKYLADPIKRSRAVYQYKGKRDEDSKFWDIITDENTGKITYTINSNNGELIDALKPLNRSERKNILNYLVKVAAQVPTSHIFSTLSTTPKLIAKSLEDIDQFVENFLNTMDK
jgi:hypothetical protein